MSRQYELTLVFDPSLSSEKREEIQEKLLKRVKVESSDDLGALNLEYKIKSQTKGHFLRLKLFGEPDQIVEIKNNLKITDGILRYLIIKT